MLLNGCTGKLGLNVILVCSRVSFIGFKGPENIINRPRSKIYISKLTGVKSYLNTVLYSSIEYRTVYYSINVFHHDYIFTFHYITDI